MAAGLGFKTFTSGEVLTAADTNGYLMQGVMVFANASARSAAITAPTEGQYSYLKDTNSTEYYDGAAWVSGVEGDISGVTAGTGISGGGTSGTVTVTNSMATTITTKGDLVPGTGSGTFSRLAAGNNGETLVADSAATTGLRYQGNYAAGKNLLLNGDCSVAQRGTSFTATGYSLDRWRSAITGTVTVSQETSDLPTNPYFRYGIKFVTGAAASYAQFQQALETTTVVGLRGLSVTISGYLKITGGYTGNWLVQKFYSTSTDTLVSQTTQIGSNVTIGTSATSSWTRFSDTFTVPTDANGLMMQFAPNTTQGSGVTVRMTGFQLEIGSVATSFQTTSGSSQQAELAMCQRYYYRQTVPIIANALGNGMVDSTTVALIKSIFPVTMRVYPTALDQTGTATDYALRTSGVTTTVCSAIPAYNNASTTEALTTFTVASGLVAGQAALGRAATTSAYLGWSAEL